MIFFIQNVVFNLANVLILLIFLPKSIEFNYVFFVRYIANNLFFIGIFFFEYVEIWLKDSWIVGVTCLLYGLGVKNVGEISEKMPRKLSTDGVWGLVSLFAILLYLIVYTVGKYIDYRHCKYKEKLFNEFSNRNPARRTLKEIQDE